MTRSTSPTDGGEAVAEVAISDTALLAGRITLDIVDHLKDETDAAAVLTGIGAAAVFELDRFGCDVDTFAATLRQLKAGRDAELARQKKEN